MTVNKIVLQIEVDGSVLSLPMYIWLCLIFLRKNEFQYVNGPSTR